MSKKTNVRNNITEYNQKVFQEFKSTLKHIIFDETLTLYILRPIAFIFVKLIYKTRITPNQVSLMTIITGVISGFIFSKGTATCFIIAGGLHFFCLVLDCVDGMIARLKNSGSAVGRIIDGVADYSVGVAVFIGYGLGLANAGYQVPFSLSISHWTLLAISAVSWIFHSMIVDYYRVEFMAHGLGMIKSTWEAKKHFKEELQTIKHEKGKLLDKVMIALYLGYSHLQLFRLGKQEVYDQKTYYEKNKVLIHLWFWIGPTAQAFVMILSAILFRPIIFFGYMIIIANIWMIVLWIIQAKVNKKILIQG
jgi:phosphatidylglycerophosphate synthase